MFIYRSNQKKYRNLNYSCNLKEIIKHYKNPRLIGKLREKILRLVKISKSDIEAKAVFLSMSIGFDNFLSEKIWNSYKKLGLAHLLVVSGYQLTCIFYSMIFLLNFLFLKLSYKVKISIIFPVLISSLGVAIFYTYITGFDPSCVRALIALGIVFLGQLVGIKISFFNLIISSFFIIILFWPLSFLNPGTQLTFGALLGIYLGINSSHNKIYQYFSVCFWATLISGLISYYWFREFYLISFITNIIVSPLASIISCQFGLSTILINLFSNESFLFLLDINIFLIDILNRVIILLSTYIGNSSSKILIFLMLVILIIKLSYNLKFYLSLVNRT